MAGLVTAGLTLGKTAGAAGAAEESTVYIGSFTPGRGLETGVVDDGTGELTVTGVVDGVPDASFLAFSPDGRFLYTTNEVTEGTVTALDRADLTVLNRQPTRGAAPTHLSVHPTGQFLLTANYTDGTVVVHPLAADGTIGESTDLVQHVGTDRDPHAHQILTDPSGQWVLAVDLGADSVFVYALDVDTGTLAQHQQLTLPAGAGPRHLAFHPDGRYAYVLGELRAEITVAAWDPAAGTLVPGQVLPTVPPDTPEPNFPAEIATTSDGRFVYASNRGEDSIATFQVHDAGERLEFQGTTPTGGAWPRHFTLSPDERRVYVSNQNSNTVTWLPRDPDTGQLSPSAGSTPVTAVGITLFNN